MKRFIAIWILLSAGLNIWQSIHIKKTRRKAPDGYLQGGHGYNKGGEHDIAPTLTSNSYHENNHLSDGFRIRKLTPRECWRLQGFPGVACWVDR
ncbi:type II DNA modification methyltransferase [Streptococcus pneumoniae]|nr:hypothetical protein A4360_05535 [Streptococcus pneumoniae]VMT38535.1 type II DNA modification methyltransferase [Streptococcus pneumoniae]